jgi:hypothetical protein
MPNAFAPGLSHPPTALLLADAALLDAEKLDAYRVALEFQAAAVGLVPKRGCAELRDQLDRASISIVLNIKVASLLLDGPWQRDRMRRHPRFAWSAGAR